MTLARFKIEQILKGHGDYGFWAFGGYDREKQSGRFQIAVSPDGEPLKEVRRLREENGRHVLSLIAPGCYIIQALCTAPPVTTITFFRIKELDTEAAEAVCERVPEEDLTQRQYDKLVPAMDLALAECLTPHNQNNHYYWRVKHE